jgi:hypothetical protein
MADVAVASGQEMGIVVGPTMLFPVWGTSIAIAALGYHYRRRGPCGLCGRGVNTPSSESSVSHNSTDRMH